MKCGIDRFTQDFPPIGLSHFRGLEDPICLTLGLTPRALGFRLLSQAQNFLSGQLFLLALKVGKAQMKTMKINSLLVFCLVCFIAVVTNGQSQSSITLQSKNLKPGRALTIDSLFVETAKGRLPLPAVKGIVSAKSWRTEVKLSDGHTITLSVEPQGSDFNLSLKAQPSEDIVKWGLTLDALSNEFYTGLLERVVDGPQAKSWATGIQEAMNLRGQKVDMIIKPTTSIYAPYYLSSRGYAAFVKGDWPGFFDFAASDPKRVKIEFEGPSFEMKIYTASTPAALVRAHALDAGPPFMPPKWLFTPWRWRDEHTQRTTYYDHTPVTAPFNSEIMEDVLMMKAFGIPNGIYWIDRPWGPGKPWGYDDFDIDETRLPNFAAMVKWLEGNQTKTVLWIAPFYQGKMMQQALAKGYTLAGQVRPVTGNNYPMVDLTNPAARTYWQDGIAKLLKLGVAGFKLDRGEEDIPDWTVQGLRRPDDSRKSKRISTDVREGCF